MTANVSIIIAERSNVLRIPNAALRFRPPESTTNAVPKVAAGGTGSPGRWWRRPPASMAKGNIVRPAPFTFSRTANRKPVQVKTGITDGIYTEITDGLSESNNVVTFASYKQGSASAQANNPFRHEAILRRRGV